MKKLVLASTSPRRIEILSFFSLPLITSSPNFEENNPSYIEDPAKYSREIAEKKALSVKEKFPKSPILAADTIVYAKGKLFTKPKDAKNAYKILKELSNSTHSVFTGICVIDGDKLYSDTEETKITFHNLTDKQIQTYHNHFYFQDKAGGYIVQKAGSIIIKQMAGCYYNVMGLPINTTRELLSKVGIDLWDYL